MSQRRQIVMLHTPGDVFAACGYDITRINTSYTQAEIDAIPAGPDIVGPPDCPYGHPPSPVAHSYTLQRHACNNAAVDAWVLSEIAIGHVTTADAQALIDTYKGELDSWLGTVYGKNGFRVADEVALVHACGVTAPPPSGGGAHCGDVNGDGVVDAKDALLIQQYVARLIPLTDAQLLRADVNGDGKVDATDALIIQQYVAGLIQSLPACSAAV